MTEPIFICPSHGEPMCYRVLMFRDGPARLCLYCLAHSLQFEPWMIEGIAAANMAIPDRPIISVAGSIEHVDT